MKTLEYVKTHLDEFEEDNFLEKRFTKRFLDFLPEEEWERYGFQKVGDEEHVPTEWTEENILVYLKRDALFGKKKAENERGISSELMAMVVNAWCKILENGLNLNGNDGWYHHRQFDVVLEHYGWKEDE